MTAYLTCILKKTFLKNSLVQYAEKIFPDTIRQVIETNKDETIFSVAHK